MQAEEPHNPHSRTASEDERWMALALEIAKNGIGRVSPNPLVGCIIVKDGMEIGRGAHERYGQSHAEANALTDVAAKGHSAKDATAYVTLEPCTHHGKTGPCAERLIAAGIARCVIALLDPNPVASGGAEKLRQAGIEVAIGVREKQARDLIRFFLKHVTTRRPYVTLKIAQSIDGRIALRNGQSQWITSEASRREVHALRATYDAVLTGSGTVMSDNPRLDVRHVEGRNPVRVVIDGELRIDASAAIYAQTAARFVATRSFNAYANRAEELTALGVEIIDAGEDAHVDLASVMLQLGKRNIQSVLVEAGPELAKALLSAGVLDEIVVFQAPIVLGGDGLPAIAPLALLSLTDVPVFELVELRPVAGSNDCYIRYQLNTVSQQ